MLSEACRLASKLTILPSSFGQGECASMLNSTLRSRWLFGLGSWYFIFSILVDNLENELIMEVILSHSQTARQQYQMVVKNEGIYYCNINHVVE